MTLYRVRLFLNHHRIGVVLAFLFGLSLGCGFVSWLWSSVPALIEWFAK